MTFIAATTSDFHPAFHPPHHTPSFFASPHSAMTIILPRSISRSYLAVGSPAVPAPHKLCVPDGGAMAFVKLALLST